MVFKDLVEIGEGQVAVKFFDFGVCFGVWVAVFSELLIAGLWLVQGVQVEVVDVSSAELVGQLVVNDVLGLRLQVVYRKVLIFLEHMEFIDRNFKHFAI